MTVPKAAAPSSWRVRLSTARELFSYLADKNPVLLPLVGALLMCSVLLVAVSLVEYVAPFVYTIF